jgi:ring-1,2-phenylacetyl-CoA epoxidase subunit PaaC
MSAALQTTVDAPLIEYVLRLGDTSLILGQRLGEWIGHAPALEEDLGLGNLALDFIGQARMLLQYAARLQGRGQSEDDLAFLRDGAAFRNFTLVEQPNGDFAHTMVRQFFIDAYQCRLFAQLAAGTDPELAGIAAKALREAQYHCRFSSNWLIRLGDGTAESHRRTQAALNTLYRYTAEFFDVDAIDRSMQQRGIAPLCAAFESQWSDDVRRVIATSTLTLPERTRGAPLGKRGAHSEHLGHLLTEMQFMQRAYPNSQW